MRNTSVWSEGVVASWFSPITRRHIRRSAHWSSEWWWIFVLANDSSKAIALDWTTFVPNGTYYINANTHVLEKALSSQQHELDLSIAPSGRDWKPWLHQSELALCDHFAGHATQCLSPHNCNNSPLMYICLESTDSGTPDIASHHYPPLLGGSVAQKKI